MGCTDDEPIVRGTTTGETTAGFSSTTAGSTSTSASEIPGEELSLGAAPGTPVAFVGIPNFDKVLLRALPGDEAAVVARLEVPVEEAEYLGRARLIDMDGWFEVRVGDVVGWSKDAIFKGGTRDVTDEVSAELGSRTVADSIFLIGGQVARLEMEGVEVQDFPIQVVLVHEDRTEDRAEALYDVFPEPDDAEYGVRLRVVADRLPDGRWGLALVEATSLCARGVVEGGICN